MKKLLGSLKSWIVLILALLPFDTLWIRLRLLSEAGFQPSVVPFDHSELEPGSYEVFVARKPSGAGE